MPLYKPMQAAITPKVTKYRLCVSPSGLSRLELKSGTPTKRVGLLHSFIKKSPLNSFKRKKVDQK